MAEMNFGGVIENVMPMVPPGLSITEMVLE